MRLQFQSLSSNWSRTPPFQGGRCGFAKLTKNLCIGVSEIGYQFMDYQKHYDALCERAKTRKIVGYTERHHITPKCLGGDDSEGNLVDLTPEEHFVAHQLLVKLFPNHDGLVWSAIQMTGHSKHDHRNNNKMYGWLKRRCSKIAKSRKGKKNGSFGRNWFHHPKTMKNNKCLPEDCPDGFVKGRKTRPNNTCIVCGKDTGTKQRKYCTEHRPPRPSFVGKKHDKKSIDIMRSKRLKDLNPAFGKIWITDGKTNHRVNKNEILPEGWRRGKLWSNKSSSVVSSPSGTPNRNH